MTSFVLPVASEAPREAAHSSLDRVRPESGEPSQEGRFDAPEKPAQASKKHPLPQMESQHKAIRLRPPIASVQFRSLPPLSDRERDEIAQQLAHMWMEGTLFPDVPRSGELSFSCNY